MSLLSDIANLGAKPPPNDADRFRFGRQSSLVLSWAEDGVLRAVRFDAVTAESIEALVTLTSHPIEEGANITDHANVENPSLSIEGFLSYTPLYQNPGVDSMAGYKDRTLDVRKSLAGASVFTPGGLTSAIAGAISDLFNPPQPPAPRVLQFTRPDDARKRVLRKVDDLMRAREAAARIRAIAGGGAFTLEDMMIEKLVFPRTTESRGGMPVQLDLKQVKIVQSERVTTPLAAEVRGQVKVNNGAKNAKKDDKSQVLKSLAASGVDGISGLFGF